MANFMPAAACLDPYPWPTLVRRPFVMAPSARSGEARAAISLAPSSTANREADESINGQGEAVACMVAALVASESGEGVDCSKSGDGVDCSMSQCMLHGSTLSAPCTRVVWDALTVVATVVVVTMATVLVEVVIVDVGTSATNACGFTEIAPMLKCASMPMMASVEFKSSPRNDEEYNLAANSFADELVTSFTNADTWPSEL
eukprot:CAMPEP_0115221164 /NCGR_PEP_ID=MMETSP0270-20121206/27822_1 /TAXON_ID=71861 /ORGANISM="Scrippsiella trochoidea, Strain CCMP3099" /LENGTH=201 /DNA_ID=CAMNT_0002635243 /DNA_START=105 /DNA_END=707 /DNA_ORIENTATION=+